MRRAASIAVIVTTAALVTSGDSFASDSPSTGRTDVAGPGLAVVSEDPYTNDDTYHRTQVEPDTSSIGSTIVTAFQTGRSFEWGASNLGWSVSSDGARWVHARPTFFLPVKVLRQVFRGKLVAGLREAFAQGQAYGTRVLIDMDLESLRDYPPFKELLRPKG